MCLYARDLRISEGQQIQRILRQSTSRIIVRRAQVVLTHVKEFVIRGTNYKNHNELKTFLDKYVKYRNKQN